MADYSIPQVSFPTELRPFIRNRHLLSSTPISTDAATYHQSLATYPNKAHGQTSSLPIAVLPLQRNGIPTLERSLYPNHSQ